LGTKFQTWAVAAELHGSMGKWGEGSIGTPLDARKTTCDDTWLFVSRLKQREESIVWRKGARELAFTKSGERQLTIGLLQVGRKLKGGATHNNARISMIPKPGSPHPFPLASSKVLDYSFSLKAAPIKVTGRHQSLNATTQKDHPLEEEATLGLGEEVHKYEDGGEGKKKKQDQKNYNI